MPQRRKTNYTTEQVERALHALAKNSGNGAETSRELKDKGIAIPERTLSEWRRRTHAERYSQIRDALAKRVSEEFGEELIQEAWADLIARRATRDEYMRQLKAGEIPARDLAGAQKNFAVSQGISVDKAIAIIGKPAELEVNHNIHLPEAVDAYLRGLGVLPTIEPSIPGAAHEIADQIPELDKPETEGTQ